MCRAAFVLVLMLLPACAEPALPRATPATADTTAADGSVAALAAEVADLGWILYSARSELGDWDIFCCRPPGTDIHHLTATPLYNEFAPQVSRDGKRLLYRRLPRDTTIDNNQHGEQGGHHRLSRPTRCARSSAADRGSAQ